MDLETLYRDTLHRCAPDALVRRCVTRDLPRSVVAIGKCAGALLDGVAGSMKIEDAIAVIPHDYPAPRTAADVLRGGHPRIDEGSFAAGQALFRFVDAHDEILFLISGGGSACVEAPLEPWFTREDLVEVNARLIDAGLAISEINAVRKHLSAIKGGRLAARVRGRSVTLLYSDVATSDLAAVASGPTLPDTTTTRDAAAILDRIGGCDRIVTILGDESLPETVHHLGNAIARLIADNTTLTREAAELLRRRGAGPVMIDGQVEGDVEPVAQILAARAAALREGEVLVAGGEPTVVKHGDGRGGRCSELAVRFALRYEGHPVAALFGSSDGVDGNTGVAGVLLDAVPVTIDREIAAAALARSDSLAIAVRIGRAIMMPPTGNNLRDLYLVARG